jgi:hypothetical protein
MVSDLLGFHFTKSLVYELLQGTSVYIYIYIYIYIHTHTHIYIHRVSQEEYARLQEGVPYVKVYRDNPKHLYPKLTGYGDKDQIKVWSSCGSTYCTC